MNRRATKIILFFCLLLPLRSEAVSMTSSSYTDALQIAISNVSDSSNRLTIYDLAFPDSRYCQTNKAEVDEIGGVKLTCVGDLTDFSLGNFSIIESSEPGLVCRRISYEECKALPSFLNEALFSLSAPGSSPSPSTSSESSSGSSVSVGSIKAYRPEVQILAPTFLFVSSSTVFINYKVTDENDKDIPAIKDRLGLGENPVSIFYSPNSDVRKRVLIAKDLPAIGSFSWDSIGLKDSDTYFIIVSATDKVDETGEAQVGQFTIDHSVPFFTVKTDPEQSKGEDVNIYLESSKDLVGTTTLNVTQNNFIPTLVPLTGSKRSFMGTYKVVSGYDGLATISVSGTDNLNNISTKIMSGGSFNVGSLPPPKPVSLDTKALGGEKDVEKIIEKKPASPFSVNLLYPREGRGVGEVAEIVLAVDDAHIGKVKDMTLSYRRAGEEYQIISSGAFKTKILWDVRDLKEGDDYEIKLEASDGTSRSEVIRKIFVDNTPPSIVVKVKSPESSTEEFVLEATGQAADKLSGIDFVEYSLDGEHWFKADMKGGDLKNKADFSIKYPYKLEDGLSEVRYRAVDGAGNFSSLFVSKIVLDVNPPRVGSYTISKNSIMLLPSDEQRFEVVSDDTLRFKISMEEDTVKASLRLGDLDIPLERSESNIWMADINFTKLGIFNILISASDRGDHSYADKKIGKIQVKERGVIAPEAKISIFILNEDEKRYVRWQAEEFGMLNPFTADANGRYMLLLPPGKYYLKIEKDGYQKIRSERFEVRTPSYINPDFELTRLEGIRSIFEPLMDKLMFYEK